MGYDDGVCDQAPDGSHDFQLAEVTGNSSAGLALVDTCRFCGAVVYDALADDRRPPLPPA